MEIENHDQKLQKAREETARDKEIQAVVQELQAEMWEATTKKKTAGVDALERLRYHTAEAKRARAEADAMHKLAGTTPATFVQYIDRTLRDQLENFQQQYVKATDAAAHPEAYGPGIEPPAVWEEGIRLAEEKLGISTTTKAKK